MSQGPEGQLIIEAASAQVVSLLLGSGLLVAADRQAAERAQEWVASLDDLPPAQRNLAEDRIAGLVRLVAESLALPAEDPTTRRAFRELGYLTFTQNNEEPRIRITLEPIGSATISTVEGSV